MTLTKVKVPINKIHYFVCVLTFKGLFQPFSKQNSFADITIEISRT